MSPEEKLEMGRKLIAEAEAEIAAKKRNWPEKIERGMCFGSNRTKAMWMATDKPGSFVCIRCSGDKGAGIGVTLGDLKDSTYLGHARDLIKIAEPEREPTGAELVGKMCQFSDDGKKWKKGVCTKYERGRDSGPYLGNFDSGYEWFISARLYREDRS